MKKLFTLLILTVSLNLIGQNPVSFEDLNLPLDAFWDGDDLTGGFYSGNAFFPNFYSEGYQLWLGGWAYSTMRDSMTSGYTNQYSAKAATGFMSDTYAIGQQGAKIIFTEGPQELGWVFLTNSTYAYNSMRDGDSFSMPYGGPSGNDPDFFLLTIKSWYQGMLSSDSVNFYLADYRFEDNSMDYIVKDWTPVDLSPLGMADSLSFTLYSSNIGAYGINTPTYFCMDNLNDVNTSTQSLIQDLEVNIAPNPSSDFVTVEIQQARSADFTVSIFDTAGRLQMLNYQKTESGFIFDIQDLADGIYLFQIRSKDKIKISKFIKP